MNKAKLTYSVLVLVLASLFLITEVVILNTEIGIAQKRAMEYKDQRDIVIDQRDKAIKVARECLMLRKESEEIRKQLVREFN